MPDTDSSDIPASGDHAPGSLQLIQSFANTLTTDPDMDRLRSREEAATWLHTAGLLPDDGGLTNSEHAALLRLRNSIKEIATARTDDEEDAEAVAHLTKALADGRVILAADSVNTVQLASAARASYPNIVAAFAIAISGSAEAGTWPRLKACIAPNCGKTFYDGSTASNALRCPDHV